MFLPEPRSPKNNRKTTVSGVMPALGGNGGVVAVSDILQGPDIITSLGSTVECLCLPHLWTSAWPMTCRPTVVPMVADFCSNCLAWYSSRLAFVFLLVVWRIAAASDWLRSQYAVSI